MKIVIQRGDIINRSDVEVLFHSLPPKMGNLINTFIVYAGTDDNPGYQYNKKEKTFGFFSPKESSLTKTDALSEIAAYLLAAHELGHIPDKLSSSKLQHYKSTWSELCANIT